MSAFFWGVTGSLGFELANICLAYSDGKRLPAHLKKPGFWFFRLLLAAFGGALAVAHEVEGKPLVAIQIGVCAPCIVQFFWKKSALEARDNGSAKKTENRKPNGGSKRKEKS